MGSSYLHPIFLSTQQYYILHTKKNRFHPIKSIEKKAVLNILRGKVFKKIHFLKNLQNSTIFSFIFRFPLNFDNRFSRAYIHACSAFGTCILVNNIGIFPFAYCICRTFFCTGSTHCACIGNFICHLFLPQDYSICNHEWRVHCIVTSYPHAFATLNFK